MKDESDNGCINIITEYMSKDVYDQSNGHHRQFYSCPLSVRVNNMTIC